MMTLLQSAKPKKRTKHKERTILLYRSDFLDDLDIITGSVPEPQKTQVLERITRYECSSVAGNSRVHLHPSILL